MTFLNETDSPLQKGMKLALMTATPGDTVEDVVKLMNILRRPGAPDLKWTDDRDVQISAKQCVEWYHISITPLISQDFQR
jgi:hypothetical protein